MYEVIIDIYIYFADIATTHYITIWLHLRQDNVVQVQQCFSSPDPAQWKQLASISGLSASKMSLRKSMPCHVQWLWTSFPWFSLTLLHQPEQAVHQSGSHTLNEPVSCKDSTGAPARMPALVYTSQHCLNAWFCSCTYSISYLWPHLQMHDVSNSEWDAQARGRLDIDSCPVSLKDFMPYSPWAAYVLQYKIHLAVY